MVVYVVTVLFEDELNGSMIIETYVYSHNEKAIMKYEQLNRKYYQLCYKVDITPHTLDSGTHEPMVLCAGE